MRATKRRDILQKVELNLDAQSLGLLSKLFTHFFIFIEFRDTRHTECTIEATHYWGQVICNKMRGKY